MYGFVNVIITDDYHFYCVPFCVLRIHGPFNSTTMVDSNMLLIGALRSIFKVGCSCFDKKQRSSTLRCEKTCRKWILGCTACFWSIYQMCSCDNSCGQRKMNSNKQNSSELGQTKTPFAHENFFGYQRVSRGVCNEPTISTWCERCLLITASPKTPGHYRYLIWVLGQSAHSLFQDGSLHITAPCLSAPF